MARAVQANKLALEARTAEKPHSNPRIGGRFDQKKPGPTGSRAQGPIRDLCLLFTHLEELGHQLVFSMASSVRWISCKLCLRKARENNVEAWLQEGPCVGNRAPHLGLYASVQSSGYDTGTTSGPLSICSSIVIQEKQWLLFIYIYINGFSWYAIYIFVVKLHCFKISVIEHHIL